MSVKQFWSGVEQNYHLLWAQDGISELRETLVPDLLLLGVGRGAGGKGGKRGVVWPAGGSCTQVGDSLAFTTDKLAFLGRHSEASSASKWPARFIDAWVLLYIRLSRAFIKIWSCLLVGREEASA